MTEEEKEEIENTKKKIETIQNGLKEGKYYGERFNLEQEIKREQTLLNLIDKLQKENQKKDKVIEEIKNKLEEHIKFCEQEAKGHLENNVCHISLKFDKSLLEIIEKVDEDNE